MSLIRGFTTTHCITCTVQYAEVQILATPATYSMHSKKYTMSSIKCTTKYKYKYDLSIKGSLKIHVQYVYMCVITRYYEMTANIVFLHIYFLAIRIFAVMG